ncbi:MAG: hypothetical protein J6V44_03505 [Methanobrevibacter sp.]|nr:hypothetical protein [Methanobrevibacter sp.]
MMETTTIFGVMLVLCGICVFYILILRSEENKVQETIKKQREDLIAERADYAVLDTDYRKLEEQKKELQLLLIKERMNSFFYDEKATKRIDKIYSNLSKAQKIVEDRLETSTNADYIELMALLNDSMCKIDAVHYYKDKRYKRYAKTVTNNKEEGEE